MSDESAPKFWPGSTPQPGRNLAADARVAREYVAAGWWGSESLSDVVARHAGAGQRGGEAAFLEAQLRLSWWNYHHLAALLAARFGELGLRHTDRLVAFLPDSAVQHVVYLAAERAGVIVVGVGHRAGRAELAHLVGHCDAVAMVSLAGSVREEERETETAAAANSAQNLFDQISSDCPSLRWHLQLSEVVNESGELDGLKLQSGQESVSLSAPEFTPGQTAAGTTSPVYSFPNQLGPSELFFLNSTSGTTGLPKCVMQTQNRWFHFNQLAVDYGQLTAQDVFAVAVPAPFGFGLWTTHFTPTCLGAPTAVMRRFSATALMELIERERATVLCAVTTQFIMLLNSPEFGRFDLSSLRVLFTGGEPIPPHKARQFEAETGAALLNFYGSNETGVLTGTRLSDPQDLRLSSGGQAVPEMNVRLYRPNYAEYVERGTEDGTDEGDNADNANENQNLTGEGQPACRGPATALGYYNDDSANRQLFTDDGWMLMGDIVRFDRGYLQVVGRTSDFIIRGGKNISAPAVEAQALSHPAVALAAAVPAPDDVFGERVALCVELHPGAELTLPQLTAFLLEQGTSKEWLPEYLICFDDLPRSSGGKVAKGELKAALAAAPNLSDHLHTAMISATHLPVSLSSHSSSDASSR